MSTDTHSKSIKSRCAALLLAAVSLAVLAKEYAFFIAAAGPAFATVTLAQDRVAEHDGANRIARTYLHYVSPLARLQATNDVVYVTYYDGQIAKFNVVSATDTIRLRFDKTVPTLPTTVSTIDGDPVVAGGGGGSSSASDERWERTDYFQRYDEPFGEQRLKRGSVTVREVERWEIDIYDCWTGCR
jgi:hypothetical protein